MRYSRFIRWSHSLVAVAIIFQMAISLIMDHPHTKRPMTVDGEQYFRWHEWIGLAALALLICTWVYRLITWKRESHRRLFPWVTASGRQSLLREAWQFVRLRWTDIPEEGALVGTVHGLGVLIATAMALSGGLIFFALGAQDIVTPVAHRLMDVHSFLATFMWVYLCGHPVMAFWHEYMGHGSLARIFRP